MKISRSDWQAYITQLSRVNQRAADQMQAWMDNHPEAEAADMVERAYALETHYGEAAATLSCEMYDAIAEAQGAQVPPAEPAPTATYGETAKAVYGTLKNGHSTVAATTSRLVKQAGADTMLQNAARDGAEFAWIPMGDTCAFCLTLASRGWQRQSKKARDRHASHIHANCDCEYCVRFDGKSTVDGYDPDALREKYDSFEGTPDEKINAWRRELRAENAPTIRAQKREAYARRKERESQNFRELVGLHTKYGSPEGLMLMGSGEEMARYSELMQETGLTQAQIRAKMFAEPEYWESILATQTEKQTGRLAEQLLITATDDELHALHMWTGSTFGNINKMMRYGEEVDPISAEAARGIESVLDRVVTTEDMIVKRGTGTKTIFEQLGVSWGDDPAAFVGKTWTDEGFVATSPLKGGGFGGPGKDNAELFILVPKGTHAAYIEQESGLVLEKEMLIQRGYSYRIVKAEYRDNPYPQFEGENDLKLWVELIQK